MFLKHVLPYKQRILDNDEEFFLQHSFSEASEVSEFDLIESTRLKELWKVMTEGSKENTRQYLRSLIEVAERV